MCRAVCFLLTGFLVAAAAGGEALVAVASNFQPTLEQLTIRFELEHGHRLNHASGSTGKLYAQIVNGAPYDVFLSADTKRPRRLLASGHAVSGSAVNYAAGLLVLWSPRGVSDGCLERFRALDFDHLAIANPALAPYGQAAREWLEHEGLWLRLSRRLVMGENVSQAWHFVASGNAEFGLVAWAQFLAAPAASSGCHYRIPRDVHGDVVQQAVLLAHGRDNPAARDFMAFLRTPRAAAIIEASGYARP